ncbi:hypothetical protein T439DRAFT_377879 [Meredithblackwellia eburnea MCA 4105]
MFFPRPYTLLLLLLSAASVLGHGGGGNVGYGRECQTPAWAATMSFLASFLCSIIAISIPTHITGYTMPKTIQTVLIWVSASVGLTYGVIAGSGFFAVMDEALKKRVTRAYLSKHRHMLWRLTITNYVLPALALAFTAASLVLFTVNRSMTKNEWSTYCTGSSSSKTKRDTAKEEEEEACDVQWISQKYLIAGGIILFVLIEVARFVTYEKFIHERRQPEEEVFYHKRVQDLKKKTRPVPPTPPQYLTTPRNSQGSPLFEEKIWGLPTQSEESIERPTATSGWHAAYISVADGEEGT